MSQYTVYNGNSLSHTDLLQDMFSSAEARSDLEKFKPQN